MRLNAKNKMLLAGFALALYLCYSFALSNTLFYYRSYRAGQMQINDGFNTPELAMGLRKKEKELAEMLARYNITGSGSFQNDLLKELNYYCAKNNLKIVSFKEPHLVRNNNFTTTSYVFCLKGSFNGSLILINKLENNPKLGIVKHLHFYKKRNYKTNTDELLAEIILQKSKA